MKFLVALVMAVAACGASRGPGGLPYVVEQARAARVPLVVELGATWCGPCRIFESRVLPDPRVQEALKGIMFVRYDVDSPAGQDAQGRIGIRLVPVVVGIDGTGRVRLLKKGTESTPEHFLEFLREVHAVLDPH